MSESKKEEQSKITSSIRQQVYGELKELFKPNTQVPTIIENLIYSESVKIMIQDPIRIWKPVYFGFYSNLKYNLTIYPHHQEIKDKILANPRKEITRIIINGPLAMNEHLTEIKELCLQSGGTHRIKMSSNTGGQVTCPSCRQKEVYRQLVQDRGGDEAFSSYLSCLNDDCGYQWRRSGG